jgi:hypothetical protein
MLLNVSGRFSTAIPHQSTTLSTEPALGVQAGSFRSAGTPAQQSTDGLATELVNAITAQRTLPQSAQAMQQAIGEARKQIAERHKDEDGLDRELSAAALIAETKLLAGQNKNPVTAQQLPRQLLSQFLIGVAGNKDISAIDQNTIEKLVINSSYAKSLGRGESTLGQTLQTIDADTEITRSDKAALQQQVVDSDYAASLGPGTVSFLRNYSSVLEQAKNHPDDLNAVAAATNASYLVEFGDPQRGLSGAKLDNAIGEALGMKEDVIAASDQQQEALASGTLERFAGKQLEATKPIAQQIEKVGGKYAEFNELPVLFEPHDDKSRLQLHVIWRVTNAEGKDTYVDDIGRTYSDLNGYIDNNKLGFGRLIVARDGKLSTDGAGKIGFIEHDHDKGFWDYVEEYGGYVLEGAGIASGVY